MRNNSKYICKNESKVDAFDTLGLAETTELLKMGYVPENGIEHRFTISDLLKILPTQIEYNDRTYDFHMVAVKFWWEVFYRDFAGNHCPIGASDRNKLADSLYEMIMTLKYRKLI